MIWFGFIKIKVANINKVTGKKASTTPWKLKNDVYFAFVQVKDMCMGQLVLQHCKFYAVDVRNLQYPFWTTYCH